MPFKESSFENASDPSEYAERIFSQSNEKNNTLSLVKDRLTTMIAQIGQEDREEVIETIEKQRRNIGNNHFDRYVHLVPTCFEVDKGNVYTVFRLTDRNVSNGDFYPFDLGKAVLAKNDKFTTINLDEYAQEDPFSVASIEDFEREPLNSEYSGALIEQYEYDEKRGNSKEI